MVLRNWPKYLDGCPVWTAVTGLNKANIKIFLCPSDSPWQDNHFEHRKCPKSPVWAQVMSLSLSYGRSKFGDKSGHFLPRFYTNPSLFLGFTVFTSIVSFPFNPPPLCEACGRVWHFLRPQIYVLNFLRGVMKNNFLRGHPPAPASS